MKKMTGILFVALLPVIAAASAADWHREIDHLLTFVTESGCSFERNGTRYNSKEAADHIKKKYDYYSAKIDSAESFIQWSATKSALSGRNYMVYCGQQSARTSRDWLLGELHRFRDHPPLP